MHRRHVLRAVAAAGVDQPRAEQRRRAGGVRAHFRAGPRVAPLPVEHQHVERRAGAAAQASRLRNRKCTPAVTVVREREVERAVRVVVHPLHAVRGVVLQHDGGVTSAKRLAVVAVQIVAEVLTFVEIRSRRRDRAGRRCRSRPTTAVVA